MKYLQTKLNYSFIFLLLILAFSAFFPPETYFISKTLATVLIVFLGFQIVTFSKNFLEKSYCTIFLIVLTFLLINMALSLSPYRTASFLCYFLQLFVLFLVFQRFISSYQFLYLMKWLIGIATILSIYGIYQYIYGFEQLASLLTDLDLKSSEIFLHKIQSRRVFSTFVLPSSFASYLLLMAPITFFSIRISKAVKSKVLYSVCLFLQGAAFLLSFSLGALLALIVSILIIISFNITKRKCVVLISIFLLFLILASLFMLYRGIDPLHPFSGRNPLILRAGNWKTALLMFRDHPFFGVGNGSFGIAFSQYREKWMNESNYAHNTYLQILAENGLVSIPLLLAFGLAFFKYLIISIRPSPLASKKMSGITSKLSPFLAFSCLSWIIHNLVDFTFYHPSVSFLFFSLLGAFFSSNISAMEKSSTSVDQFERQNGNGGKSHNRLKGDFLRLSRLSFTAVLTLVFLFSIQFLVSESYFEKALRMINEKDFQEAEKAIERAEFINPFKSNYRIIRAQLLMEESYSGRDLTLAEREAERAISLDGWIPYYYKILSDIQVLSNKSLMAFISITKASELYPVKEDYQQRKKIMKEVLEKLTVQEEENVDNGSSAF